MKPSDFALPVHLFPDSIEYANRMVAVVTMRTTDGGQYRFGAAENGQYTVMYNYAADRTVIKMTSISANDAPASLKRIFEAGTLERVLELQASRQLIECAHQNLK